MLKQVYAYVFVLTMTSQSFFVCQWNIFLRKYFNKYVLGTNSKFNEYSEFIVLNLLWNLGMSQLLAIYMF